MQTHKVVVTPTAASTVQAVTHGTPQIGGLLSDFYGKYGTPHNQGIGNSETWLVSSQPLILVNADHDASGKTTNVGVTEQDMSTGTTWSKDQMINYCAQFMPGDATAFNSVGDYNQGGLFIDYHSSIGEIVDLLAQGSCVITMSNS